MISIGVLFTGGLDFVSVGRLYKRLANLACGSGEIALTRADLYIYIYILYE